MKAPVVQWQIIAPDPNAIAKFYQRAFGWSITTANALGYRQVDTGEHGTPGGIWPAPPGTSPFTQLFIRVPNVEQAVQSATELGATVIVPPATLPDGDTLAVIRDPAGLSVGLVQARDP